MSKVIFRGGVVIIEDTADNFTEISTQSPSGVRIKQGEGHVYLEPEERDALMETLQRHKETGSVMEPRGLFTYKIHGNTWNGYLWESGRVSTESGRVSDSLDDFRRDKNIKNIKFATPPT